jgi:transposase
MDDERAAPHGNLENDRARAGASAGEAIRALRPRHMPQTHRRLGAWRWNEERRAKAWELAQKGWTQQRIAGALGVTQSSISQWIARAKAGGEDALRSRKPKGRAPRLSPEQRHELITILSRGPTASGLAGPAWTLARVSQIIQREFGVAYQQSQVSRILKASGWSLKRPTEDDAPASGSTARASVSDIKMSSTKKTH